MSGPHGPRDFSAAGHQWGIDHFDSLPFPARMRALAEYARELPESDYRSIHATLDAGSTYERHIGLHLAVVRRDFGRLEEALADSALRHRALSAAIRLPVSDGALSALALSAVRRDRLAVHGVLRRSRRRTLADELVPTVHRRYGREDVASLLPACSPEVVARWLPAVNASVGLLHRLVRTAPTAVAEFVVTEADAQDGYELANWLRSRGNLLALLATRRPRVVAEVLCPLPRLIPKLASDDPRILGALLSAPDLLLRHTSPARLGFHVRSRVVLPAVARRAIAALPAEQAATLLAGLRGPLRTSLLSAIPTEGRRRIVDLAYPEDQPVTGITAEELQLLPEPDRVELTRRILDQPTSERGWRHLEITAALPYAEAVDPLLESTASHRYQERHVAWEALLGCAVHDRDPEAFVHALHAAGRAWHDQDLVRAAALRPVAGASTRLLSRAPLASLREVVAATTRSRDAGRETFTLLARWLTRSLTSALARDHADRAAELEGLLARLHSDPRSPGHPGLRLSPEIAPRLWAGLREQVLHDARSGRFGLALRAAALCGAALGSVPELDTLIGEIARTANDPLDAAAAARSWIATPLREQRVAELVAHDPRFGRLPDLWEVVATRRTDLIDDLLARIDPLPAISPGRRGRWTPAQRAAVEARSRSVARDEHAQLRERESAVSMLTDPAALVPITEDAPPPVAAAALTTLGRTSPERALPVLLDQAGAGGHVGRAAVRALGTALECLPDNVAAERLRRALSNRTGAVGPAKEAARLLGHQRPVGAVDVLVEGWAEPTLHHDVRAAVVTSLVGFLGEDARIPGILTEATRDHPAVRAAVLAIAPHHLVPGQRPTWARVLADALVADGSAASADLVNAYGACWKEIPEALDRLAPLVTATNSDHLFQVVSELVVRSGRPRALSAVVDRLVLDIETRSSTIAWRRLAELSRSRSRTGVVPTDIGHEIAVSRILIDGCRSVGMEAATVPLLMNLAGLSLEGPVDLDIWDELIDTVDERPHRWQEYGLYSPGRRQRDIDTALAVVDHLTRRAGSVPGLLAVQVLTSTVARSRRIWAERLAALRNHPDPDVRDAARSVREPERPH